MIQLTEAQYIRVQIKQLQDRLQEITAVDCKSDTEILEAIDPKDNEWGPINRCYMCHDKEPCQTLKGGSHICEPCYDKVISETKGAQE